jgi:hypothetical protein
MNPLVELRGFEPLTPCMPCSFGPPRSPRSETSAQANRPLGVTVTDRYVPLVTVAYGTSVARLARTVMLTLAARIQLAHRVKSSSGDPRHRGLEPEGLAAVAHRDLNCLCCGGCCAPRAPSKSRFALNVRTCLPPESGSCPGPTQPRGVGPRCRAVGRMGRIATLTGPWLRPWASTRLSSCADALASSHPVLAHPGMLRRVR